MAENSAAGDADVSGDGICALNTHLPVDPTLADVKESLELSRQELTLAGARLHAVLASTSDALLLTDTQGTTLEVNEQFIRLWGLAADSIDSIHQMQPGAVLENCASQCLDATAYLVRVREIEASADNAIDEIRLADGRIFKRFSRVIHSENQRAGRVWSFREITETRLAEELRSQLIAIVESADDAIIGKTLDGIITSWNGGARRTFGYRPEEVLGKSITLLIPPERLDEEPVILGRLRRGERIEHYETERIRKDGARITVSLSVSPIRDGEGLVVGASKIARDISEQRRQERALHASEARLRAVVEATPECVKIVAPDGNLEFMNRAGLTMIECGSDQTVEGCSVFSLITPEHRSVWTDYHRRICAGERLSWEFELVTLKGTRRWMETHAVPLLLADGRLGQLAVTREITARKQIELEREELLNSERAARSEAEYASRLKDEFLATLSHELRTPLTAILGWSQLLTPASSQADLEMGLEAIQQNARAQTQIIEDLLDMSRIISGKVRLDVQWTYLADILEAAVDSVRPTAEAKNIRLRKILDPHAGPVSGDPTRLQQILWNLLTNAIKFTPKGGKVEVLLERVNSHLEITVNDSGIGIEPEFLPHVFERFRQADSSMTRNFGGLGLGLSIVKNLTELHGGTVRAKSAGAGQGATFIVSLPLAPLRSDEQREHPASWKANSLNSQKINLDGITVLVVDDEPDARSLITRLLTQHHAVVRSAASADEGFNVLCEHRPDVLVSDIGMPGKDGYQFIRSIRALSDDRGGKTPAIALTAFARSEDRTRAMMAGYNVHVAKPIEPQELIATICSLTGRIGQAF